MERESVAGGSGRAVPAIADRKIRAGSLPDQIEHLHARIEDVRILVEQLSTALAPALMTINETGPDNVREIQEPATTTGRSVHNAALQVGKIGADLRELLERIDL